MLPNELYKRRHYGTPQSMLLIMTNTIVFAVCASIFAADCTIHWFFWVLIGLLAIYNFLNIRKDREEYTRIRIIAYVISVVFLIAMLIAFRFTAASHCHVIPLKQ